MMGPMTLNEIREELRHHFGKDGEDPIVWLEHRKAAAPKEGDIIDSLLAVLRRPVSSKPKRQRKVDLVESLQSFTDALKKAKRKKPRPAKKR